MSPLAAVDALDVDLTRRRLRLAAARGAWVPTRPRPVRHGVPRPSRRLHAARTHVEFDALLALGVVPVTVGSVPGDAPDWRALAGEADIAVVDPAAGPDALVARRVDMVVASALLAAAAPAEISGYAQAGLPVLVLPSDDPGEQLRVLGDALDLRDRARRAAATIDDDLRTFTPSWRPGSVAALTDRGDGRIHCVTARSPLGALLRRLGLPAPSVPQCARPAATPDVVTISREQLGEIDAHLVLGLDPAGGALAALEADPALAAVPAVRGGRYRRLDPVASYAVTMPSALTVRHALDALAAALVR